LWNWLTFCTHLLQCRLAESSLVSSILTSRHTRSRNKHDLLGTDYSTMVIAPKNEEITLGRIGTFQQTASKQSSMTHCNSKTQLPQRLPAAARAWTSSPPMTAQPPPALPSSLGTSRTGGGRRKAGLTGATARATSSSGVGHGGGEASVVTAGEEPGGESTLSHPVFPESDREARGRGRR
jgi:hypothetical protein